jgi:hypothetical protein
MHQPKRILICPLDWGLGHATRCIPVIRHFLNRDAEIIIAADGRSLELLKQEFPQLNYVVFSGYNINYPDKGSMILKMILSAPKIIKGIKKEHFELDQIITDHKIDTVISDNRYGCWNKKTKNIFITHQLMIKSPFAEKLLHKIVLNHVKNFNECWVPDLATHDNLSGDLAHKYELPQNAFFIGFLSRFKMEKTENTMKLTASQKYDLLVIISGPEPQRSNFERMIIAQVYQTDFKTLIILGKPEVSVFE